MMRTITTILAAALIFAANCQAQNNLSDILNKVSSAAKTVTETNSSSGTTASSILNTITNIVANNTVKDSDIPGEWNYKSSAISFKSESALSNLASGAAEGTIENKINTYLSKVGIKEGAFSINFTSDGNVTMKLGSKSFSGTWTYNATDAQISLKIAKIITAKAYVTISDGTMKLLFDASSLLKLVKSLASGSSNSTIAALTTLLNSYDQMYAGFKLAK